MTNYKELVKQRTSIPGYIEEVERFETWWNKNLATVISYYDSGYRVFLLVYDPVYITYQPAVFPTDSSCGYWGRKSRGNHSYPSDARSEANWLRGELTYSWNKGYDNPILVIHPYSDCSRSFSDFVREPYVVRKYSTSHLKPFDVVKTHTTRFGFNFYHEGVYLGKIDDEFKVCQFTSKEDDTTIDRWSKFAEGEANSNHPVIPFKNYRDIAGQIVWAKDNNFRKGNYSLPNRNCEHFANMIVYGINYSQQVESNRAKLTAKTVAQSTGIGAWGGFVMGTSIAAAPLTGGLSLIPAAFGAIGTTVLTANQAVNHSSLNNNKSNVCLETEIRETNGLLGKKFDYETKKYETKYLQQIPPKENCRIM